MFTHNMCVPVRAYAVCAYEQKIALLVNTLEFLDK